MKNSPAAIAIIVVAHLAIAGTPALAQSGHTTVLVGAGDGATGQFLRGVQVSILSLRVVQYTDSMGQARLAKIPAGTYTVEARRVGYQPLTAPILVRSEDSLEVVMLMRATPELLNPVIVSRSGVPSHLRAFEDHRAKGVGQFVTMAQIDSAPGASLQRILETHVRGVNVIGDNAAGMHITTFRPATDHALNGVPGPCMPVVFLDGVQLTDDTGRGPNLAVIDVTSIGGIEFYNPSEVPLEYRASGMSATSLATAARKLKMPTDLPSNGATSTSLDCGVMAIWTRP